MIEQFAKANNFKLRTSGEDGTKIIAGRQGHIFEYSASEMGVLFMPPALPGNLYGKWTPKCWGNFRRKALALGMTLRQCGDSEGTLSFHPANKSHIRLARTIAKVRTRLTLTPEQLQKRIAGLTAFRKRSTPRQEGPLSAI